MILADALPGLLVKVVKVEKDTPGHTFQPEYRIMRKVGKKGEIMSLIRNRDDMIWVRHANGTAPYYLREVEIIWYACTWCDTDHLAPGVCPDCEHDKTPMVPEKSIWNQFLKRIGKNRE